MHFAMSLRSAVIAGLLIGNFAAAHVIGSDFQQATDAIVEKREPDNSPAEVFAERDILEDDFEDAPEIEAREPKKKKGKGKGKKGKGKKAKA
ncbi:hypothetical protein QBC47DRAFT_373474 [Echria macrotheca]|uniref:Uncharacterized protein n=1 Tax=Echria macrotheca TaxID=438768 RepID=A0AAJ0BGR1_9PEZI|nr:hypothetical protein QBC47DRAFT_373474 [Echria macrotheca]